MRRLKGILRLLLGLLFIGAGLNHFLQPAFYLRAMPPYLPWHREAVLLSGVAEIFLGGLLLIQRTTSLAAGGLVALLVAVFPANVHMALHPTEFPEFPPVTLWVRLPLQAGLIAWALWYTSPHRKQAM